MSKPIAAVSTGKGVSMESVPDILERELSGVVKDWLERVFVPTPIRNRAIRSRRSCGR